MGISTNLSIFQMKIYNFTSLCWVAFLYCNVTVFPNAYTQNFSCHMIFITSNLKCKTTHQISKTISYVSAFDSVFNCIKHFFKTPHTILYLKHKNLTGSDLLSFSKHKQSKCYTYSPGHKHTLLTCANTNCLTDH